jgi:outer membrane lipopolysaccharide assembly protein LptE/RlpB
MRRGTWSILPAAALGVAALLFGCGYHLVGKGGTLPEGVKSMAVPLLANETRRPEVEQRVTEQLVRELNTRSGVKVLAGKEGADALLTGAITGYESSPVVLNPEGRATRYEITMTARMRLEDLRGNQILWANDQYVFRSQYDVPEDTSFFDQEIVAIDQVAREFAVSVVTAILEGF